MQKSYLYSFFLFLSIVFYTAPNFAQNVVPTEPPQAAQQDQKINLNTADVAMLTHAFKGIGKMRAEAIVHYREEHGQFKSVEDLAHVHGLGLSFVNRNLTALNAVFSVS